MRVDDEVYVKAIAGARVVRHVDVAGIMVVRVEHCAVANIAMSGVAGSCPK